MRVYEKNAEKIQGGKGKPNNELLKLKQSNTIVDLNTYTNRSHHSPTQIPPLNSTSPIRGVPTLKQQHIIIRDQNFVKMPSVFRKNQDSRQTSNMSIIQPNEPYETE